MISFTLQKLNHEEDLPQIDSWSIRYNGDPRFDTIKKYILEDDLFISLSEVIDTNHDKLQIGEDEKHIAFTIKNNKNEILGFVLTAIIDIRTSDTSLVIKYIVINPEYQGQGIGFQALSELINNHKKYFHKEANNVFFNRGLVN
jgi:ribosomal protein S18 acetylase RimI-like enzyme